jgi:hypothetical protein
MLVDGVRRDVTYDEPLLSFHRTTGQRVSSGVSAIGWRHNLDAISNVPLQTTQVHAGDSSKLVVEILRAFRQKEDRKQRSTKICVACLSTRFDLKAGVYQPLNNDFSRHFRIWKREIIAVEKIG